MPYPGRPSLPPAASFRGSARSGRPAAGDLQQQLEAYVIEAYVSGRSLREVGELVDRSQTAVRRVLAKHQVPLRPAGAPRLWNCSPSDDGLAGS